MSRLHDVLSDSFGLKELRPGQGEVIDAVCEGRPTVAVMPTGAGKSLCYQLPAVMLGGLTLVVSPLIALMKDQVDSLVALGIRGGVDQRHGRLRTRRGHAAGPGR